MQPELNTDTPDAKCAEGPQSVEHWAVVSFMGHTRLAGKVSEVEFCGAKVGKLDVPNPDGSFWTRLFTAQSLFSVEFCGEEEARAVARNTGYKVVHPWEMPRPAAIARFEIDVSDDGDTTDEDTSLHIDDEIVSVDTVLVDTAIETTNGEPPF